MISQGSPELVLKRRPFGSWLLGPADQSPRVLRFRLRVLMMTFSIGSNLIGAAVVFVLAVFVLPGPPLVERLQVLEAITIPAYFLIAVLIGCVWSTRLTRRVTRWVDENRPATRKEQIATLQLPLRLTLIEVFLWLLACVIFTVMTLTLQPENAVRIAATIFDGAIITCAVSYLLTEFALRPVAARALADSPPPRRLLAAGLKTRTVFFWAAGSAVPVAGLMLAAVLALIEQDVFPTRLSVMILALGMVVLLNGWLLTVLSARSVVAPVRSVRNALTLIGEGQLNVRIPVFDGTELGSLQAGFNKMAEELPEATAGIGVTAGIVVAGTVGDVRRHEYTVIGDPVNETARLTELAKSTPARLVASMTAVNEAAPAEAAHWHPGDQVTVGVRSEPTHLGVPQ